MRNNAKAGARLAAPLALTLLGPASAQQDGPFFVEPDVEVIASYFAENAGDSFGFVGEAIGDIDGDGAPEYLIGAPGFPEAALTGRIYVYDGANGTVVTTFDGNDGDAFGLSVAGIGDADGDGVPDYAAGGPFAANGRVVVFSGADHSVLHDLSGGAGSQFGYDLNAAGDVDGDGHADFIVGSRTGAIKLTAPGVATLYSGASGKVLWEAEGFGDNNNFGAGISGLLADVTGDGVPDQVVGAFSAGAGGTGLAYILSGADGSLYRTLEPRPEAGTFGWFFAHAAGDVDADGVADAYVGDFSDNALGSASGRGYVFSGDTGEALRVFDAEREGDGFGIGRGAGDVNGDGYADLHLAAYTHSFLDGVQAGKAFIFSGRNGGVIRTFTGTVAGAQLGFDAVPIGDVNGDALPDYLITGAEVAHVVAGVSAAPPARVAATCELLSSFPDEAFAAPAGLRRLWLCLGLARARALLRAERYARAARSLESRVLRRLDGALGGDAGDDWIIDDSYAGLLAPRVRGLVLMADSLAED